MKWQVKKHQLLFVKSNHFCLYVLKKIFFKSDKLKNCVTSGSHRLAFDHFRSLIGDLFNSCIFLQSRGAKYLHISTQICSNYRCILNNNWFMIIIIYLHNLRKSSSFGARSATLRVLTSFLDFEEGREGGGEGVGVKGLGSQLLCFFFVTPNEGTVVSWQSAERGKEDSEHLDTEGTEGTGGMERGISSGLCSGRITPFLASGE